MTYFNLEKYHILTSSKGNIKTAMKRQQTESDYQNRSKQDSSVSKSQPSYPQNYHISNYKSARAIINQQASYSRTESFRKPIKLHQAQEAKIYIFRTKSLKLQFIKIYPVPYLYYNSPKFIPYQIFKITTFQRVVNSNN